MNELLPEFFLKGLFFLLVALFCWKIIWNVFFPIALFFWPSFVLSSRQKNTALMPGYELAILVFAFALSAFIDDQYILYSTKFVTTVGLCLIVASYVPLFAVEFFILRPRRKRNKLE